jgi:hypothetical protein
MGILCQSKEKLHCRMKIEFQNLGPLYQANVQLGDLTILTGYNNTGKTYVTYAVYGLLAGWRHLMPPLWPHAILPDLVNKGQATLDLKSFSGNAFRQRLNQLAQTYQEQLAQVLAGEPDRFSNTKVTLEVPEHADLKALPINIQQTLANGDAVTMVKPEGETVAQFALQSSFDEPTSAGPPREFFLDRWITETLLNFIYQPCFPRVHISSSERTGAAIFQRELNLGRNRLIETLADLKPGERPNPFVLLQKMASSYAFPVQQNVEFLTAANLEPLQRQSGPVAAQRPDILTALEDLTGGSYRSTKEGAFFSPNQQRGVRLRLGECSSAVRSLLDVTYYIRHVLRPGDCFMIDEPELNLHPKNQRLFARLIGRLVNAGVKVFLTTHSDYIIRELNTLILLAGRTRSQPELAEELKYHEKELVRADQVRFYRTTDHLLGVNGGKRRRRLPVLEEIGVTPEAGIEVASFDSEIEELNRIQDVILYTPEKTHAASHD